MSLSDADWPDDVALGLEYLSTALRGWLKLSEWPRPGFTCSHCGSTSYNPSDIANRYCGRCHHYCDDLSADQREPEPLNMEFLVKSAERLLAEVDTAVVLHRPAPPGGRRHGPDPTGEVTCLCGWQSPNPAQDRAPLAHHYRAILELGAELGADR